MLIQRISGEGGGALKPPRGSFKHELNFNCFVQDVSETT